MINFRYHIVSLIAVFLALGIGVIIGTAVIDSAVVDRLESQQRGLERNIENVAGENDRLRGELSDERETAERLAEEGSQRLLDGTLTDVPVISIAARQAETSGFEDLVSLLESADARHVGTLWLTERFDLDDEGERNDLAEVLTLPASLSVTTLRTAAIGRLADGLRPDLAPDPTVVALRDAGFVDYEAPEGVPDEELPAVEAGTRVVVALAGPATSAVSERLTGPLLENLVQVAAGEAVVPVLAVAASLGEDDELGLIAEVRDDDELSGLLSTVDNIDEFAGRLAAVLALADLGAQRTGHYGRADGAQRLLPAPVGTDG